MNISIGELRLYTLKYFRYSKKLKNENLCALCVHNI